MRKVLFKKWIPKQTERVGGSMYESVVKGTGRWSDEYSESGIFHQWANAYEESDAGFGNYTVALIEMADGTIGEILPSNIKFI